MLLAGREEGCEKFVSLRKNIKTENFKNNAMELWNIDFAGHSPII